MNEVGVEITQYLVCENEPGYIYFLGLYQSKFQPLNTFDLE